MGETIEVNVHGPLFDGRAAFAVDEFLHDAVYNVGSQGLANWQLFLDTSIRHPTPYYETQVTVQRVATDLVEVHDRGVVYGPWLEGVGSRNRTTRFKGYFSLRRAYQQLHTQIPGLLVYTLRPYLERMR
jgi:hypothetical protein